MVTRNIKKLGWYDTPVGTAFLYACPIKILLEQHLYSGVVVVKFDIMVDVGKTSAIAQLISHSVNHPRTPSTKYKAFRNTGGAMRN